MKIHVDRISVLTKVLYISFFLRLSKRQKKHTKMFEIKRLEWTLLHTEAFCLCLHPQAAMVSMKKEQNIDKWGCVAKPAGKQRGFA